MNCALERIDFFFSSFFKYIFCFGFSCSDLTVVCFWLLCFIFICLFAVVFAGSGFYFHFKFVFVLFICK